jgi:hypothetical protein
LLDRSVDLSLQVLGRHLSHSEFDVSVTFPFGPRRCTASSLGSLPQFTHMSPLRSLLSTMSAPSASMSPAWGNHSLRVHSSTSGTSRATSPGMLTSPNPTPSLNVSSPVQYTNEMNNITKSFILSRQPTPCAPELVQYPECLNLLKRSSLPEIEGLLRSRST